MAEFADGRGFRWRNVLMLIGGLAVVATIGLLSHEVHALRPLQAQVRRLRAFPHPGQWVPTVTAISSTGDSVTLGETTPGRAQLLIFFTTSCEFCKATVETWKSMDAELSADSAGRFDVYWVSGSNIDSTRAYAARHGIVGSGFARIRLRASR